MIDNAKLATLDAEYGLDIVLAVGVAAGRIMALLQGDADDIKGVAPRTTSKPHEPETYDPYPPEKESVSIGSLKPFRAGD